MRRTGRILVKRQKQICRRNVELMDSVRGGAMEAIQECQAQFKAKAMELLHRRQTLRFWTHHQCRSV